MDSYISRTMSAVAELFVIVVIVIVKAKSPAEFSLPLFSPLFDHQLLSLWKSQIAHTDTCHHISGINLLIQFASFLQINVVHFHPVSHASSSSSSSLLPPITPLVLLLQGKKTSVPQIISIMACSYPTNLNDLLTVFIIFVLNEFQFTRLFIIF